LDLARTTVVGSGPTGQSVTLSTSISFKSAAVNKRFTVQVAASDDFGHREEFIDVGTVQVGKASKELPSSTMPDLRADEAPLEFAIRSSANPVSKDRFSIYYSIPTGLSGSHVEISVLDVTGRRIRTLVSRSLNPGHYEAEWDLRDELGESVANGVFFYRIHAGALLKTQKFVLMRR
jgi:hypothetical protein